MLVGNRLYVLLSRPACGSLAIKIFAPCYSLSVTTLPMYHPKAPPPIPAGGTTIVPYPNCMVMKQSEFVCNHEYNPPPCSNTAPSCLSLTSSPQLPHYSFPATLPWTSLAAHCGSPSSVSPGVRWQQALLASKTKPLSLHCASCWASLKQVLSLACSST